MYEQPTLKKFGTFRELTRLGNDGLSDGATVQGISGCIVEGREIGCPTAS